MNNFYVLHDSQNTKFRNPFGAVEVSRSVSLEIYGECFYDVFLHIIFVDGKSQTYREIKLQERPLTHEEYQNVVKEIGEGRANNVRSFVCNSSNLEVPGLYYYYFAFKRFGEQKYYGNNIDNLGGIGNVYDFKDMVRWYQITVYEKEEVCPSYEEGAMYQVFVDRFFNGNKDGHINNPRKNCFIYGSWKDKPMYIKNEKGDIARWDFYGGNLLGVVKKLDYIKSLGVSTIYLNPIFDSVSCHKYDTGDYEKIDQMFGDDRILKMLCNEASKRDIKIILDGVFSHTGWDSKYFNKFRNYDSIGAYESKESPYYKWYNFRNFPDDYECWWNFRNQPNVNELEESFLDYIVTGENSIIRKWMRLGVSGWRLDVADELPDRFIECIKKVIKEENKNAILIGEVWEDASNKISYGERRKYFWGKELDSVTNYPFKDTIINYLLGYISSKEVSRRIMSLKENYPKEKFHSLMNLLGTHDTERVLTVITKYNKWDAQNIELSKKLLKLGVSVQMTFLGIPLIYYGDEVGLLGEKDPDNRRPYPWGEEDRKILRWYRKLGRIRRNYDALKYGDIEFIRSNDDVLAFRRTLEDQEFIILTNRNMKDEFNLNISINSNNFEVLDILEKGFEISIKDYELGIKLPKLSAAILRVIKK